MLFIQYCKLQFACLVVLVYMGRLLITQGNKLIKIECNKIFDTLYVLGEFCVLFDGITAYTVNCLDTVSPLLNMICHLCFLLLLNACLNLLVIYVLSITSGLPKTKVRRGLLYLQLIITSLLIIVFIPGLEYRQGQLTNYSMGKSVYVCFVTLLLSFFESLFILVKQIRYIAYQKRISIFSSLIAATILTLIQVCIPEALFSSLGITFILIGVCFNQENPAEKQLDYYHSEMVTGFATLVENRDGSTGGHIRRTQAYVKLIAEELIRQNKHLDILTIDYVNALCRAAPMHDIGKIGIPDAILQKSTQLTPEEYEIMKMHAVKGSELIKNTFGHLNDKTYEGIAYNVARYHHERWDGTGYPEGLSQKDIPLCARIMAVADVFDALAVSRCYRNAMSLTECFSVIEKGRGVYFDPEIVDLFSVIRPKVESIFYSTI